MNIKNSVRVLVVLISFFTNSLLTLANTSNNDSERCGSPYFQIITDENTKAALPLKSTHVEVTISGVIADVNVKQTYTNTGQSSIEAIYVFPASTRAAVYAMEMTIGDRVIIAQIKEKEQARKDYESAKAQGKVASLLEEERPNVFKMNVANINPGATVEVSLSYTELLVPTDKTYEFVYPTVVGPRYVSKTSQTQKSQEKWTANPYLEEGESPTSTLNIDVKLNAGLPIQDIKCSTHKNSINYIDKTNVSMNLTEPKGGNRDFVMHYRLAGDEIESGIMVYEDTDGENFFLAMMQAPARPTADIIPAREYVFIVDVSGSMRGFPLEITKELMQSLLSELNEGDLFNIIFFAGSSYIYSEASLPVNESNINKALHFMDEQHAHGGTEILCALQAALKLNINEDYARSFVILTDGYVRVEKETFDYIRQNLGNANFFSFGIGSSVNRYIIEGMAHVGYGEPFIALNKEEAIKEAEKFKKYISQPVLTNISYNFDGFDAYDIVPEKVPDLFAERPIIISGKYKGKSEGAIKITGTTGNSTITKTLNIQKSSSDNKALKYLWAREKIRLLGDYNKLGADHWSSAASNKDKLKTEITQLGLKYHLLTEYTSFIAIDSEISNSDSTQITIHQPLPLPRGVSNHAVGSASSGFMIRGVSKIQKTSQATPTVGSSPNLVINDNADLEIMEFDEETEEDDNKIFTTFETLPSFPGGDAALMNYLRKNVKYPETEKNNGIQGRVYVEFIIDSLGNMTDVRILKGVNPILDQEALRVVKAMPQWIPGSQRGKNVSVSYRLPINFSTAEYPTPNPPSSNKIKTPTIKNYTKVPPC